ncbi:hypothetical protein F4778DRAFT_77532 [Xylariomycetidae sp. FL2044]|nr:hypothetical protein F4778DRAFT_77532 [Xylariomycetidae sp. FL2044]
MSDTTPLLPRSNNPQGQGQADSHSITLRACHSPWRGISQKMLLAIRLILAGYLTSVLGVSMKYKTENGDKHTNWQIPFQFSTVSFLLLWTYHLITALWTGMHLWSPKEIELDPEECEGHQLRASILRFLSPTDKASTPNRRYAFSMFYTITHVFSFMNTLIFWGILVPSGHGGFKPPNVPHHHHGGSNQTALYDPDKGLFEEDGIKAFSIINVWTITSLIAGIEIFFLNSIRRQTPVASHAVGVTFLSVAYLIWAELGKLITGHAGLFFIDPKLMGDAPYAALAACVAFVTLSPGIFSYMYGLIGMRESMTAHVHSESSAS